VSGLLERKGKKDGTMAGDKRAWKTHITQGKEGVEYWDEKEKERTLETGGSILPSPWKKRGAARIPSREKRKKKGPPLSTDRMKLQGEGRKINTTHLQEGKKGKNKNQAVKPNPLPCRKKKKKKKRVPTIPARKGRGKGKDDCCCACLPSPGLRWGGGGGKGKTENMLQGRGEGGKEGARQKPPLLYLNPRGIPPSPKKERLYCGGSSSRSFFRKEGSKSCRPRSEKKKQRQTGR